MKKSNSFHYLSQQPIDFTITHQFYIENIYNSVVCSLADLLALLFAREEISSKCAFGSKFKIQFILLFSLFLLLFIGFIALFALSCWKQPMHYLRYLLKYLNFHIHEQGWLNLNKNVLKLENPSKKFVSTIDFCVKIELTQSSKCINK